MSSETPLKPCQHCEDAEADTAVAARIGGMNIGAIYVCSDCEEEITP